MSTVSIKLHSPAHYLILISSELKSDINVKRRQTKQYFSQSNATNTFMALRNLIPGSRGQRSPGSVSTVYERFVHGNGSSNVTISHQNRLD